MNNIIFYPTTKTYLAGKNKNVLKVIEKWKNFFTSL